MATRIAIVIPARMNSERLPKKALIRFHEMPMIEHVRRRGLLNSYEVPVFVTSGDEQILNEMRDFGALIYPSKLDHLNGTSRVHEFSVSSDFSHFVILQGDEILVLPEQLDALITAIKENPEIDFWNMVTPLTDQEELSDTSVVKCLMNQEAEIFSIFRKSPLTAEISLQLELVHKICGLFAVTRTALSLLTKNITTPLEKCESIEQLKYLELGQKINSIVTPHSYPSVNLPKDIEVVTKFLDNDVVQRSILKEIF